MGLQVKAAGEQMFENLPEGWKVEESFAVSREQTAAIARQLGGRILKLTNTVLSIHGRRLQVNVLYCPTVREAEKIYKAVLKAHNGLAASAAKDGKMVIEFAKSNDVELMHKLRQTLGLPDARLDSLTAKFITNIPDGWQVQESFIAPQAQTVAIGKKLGGRIKNLSNTIFSVDAQTFQVNVIDCATPGAAEKIHESILKMKPDPAFCLLLGSSVVEFVGDDVELAKKAVYELGIKPGGTETIARDLLDLLVKKDYPEAVKMFDSTMKKELPAEKLQQAWNSIIVQAGPFKEQLGARKEKIPPYEAVFVTCKFERALLDAKVVFNQKQQICGLFFVPPQSPADE